MKSTAWAFCAVSSSPQEITLDEQLKWAQGVAKSQGWNLQRIWKGVSSGKTGTRKLLDELLAALRNTPKAERPERVMMIRIDRLGRGTGIESIAALAELKRLGVSVWTREDGDVRLEKASDSILPAIRTIVAALENETRSDRVRAGQARRRAAGKHLGAVPYGCVLVDGKPVRFEPEAQIVEEVFELIGKGWGLERIAGTIRPKAPPKRQSDGSERALTWGQSTVRSLYKSEVVRRLIDPKLVARADRARKENERYRPTGEWEWPLRGAVRCTCGHKLMGMATGVKPHRIRYYRCRSHPYDERPEGNRRPGHRADALEAAFLAILKRLTDDPDALIPRRGEGVLKRLQAQETALRTQLARLDRRRRRACELAEDGAYSGKELRERLDRIDGERRGVSGQLEGVVDELGTIAAAGDSAQRLVDQIALLPATWLKAPIEERQTLAKAVAHHLGGLVADPKKPGTLRVTRARSFKTKNSCRCNPKSSIR